MLFDGLTFTAVHDEDEPSGDIVRILGGANEGVAEIHDIVFTDCRVDGNFSARVGVNIQGVEGLRLYRTYVRRVYGGHRSQGMFIGGCSDIEMRRVEVMHCGWNPADPSTADAQNQGVYIRAINGLGVHGVDVAGCWFGHSSSWGLAISSDEEPITDVKVRRCVFSGGGKGLVLGAALPGIHRSPLVEECVFDGVGHGYDGSPGIGMLIEGAEDALIRHTWYGAHTPNDRPLLHDGELGKPPSSGVFEEPIEVGDLCTAPLDITHISAVLRNAGIV